MRISRLILAFLIFGFVGQMLYYFPNLPQLMASHFNSLGEPDGWMSKTSFLIFEMVILFIIIGKFTLLPWLIEKIPNNLINLPNKEHWLAPERRAETFNILRVYFEWFSVGLLSLFIVVNEMVFRANLNRENLSNAVWIVLVAYLLFVVVWVVKFILQFKIKK
jgi:uncharacterized membrane protein